MNLRLEKRLAPRRITMIPAIISFEGGRRTEGCIIRNLSDTGAKLEVSAVRAIPQRFELLVPGHRPQNCTVAWRAMRELGVQFVPQD